MMSSWVRGLGGRERIHKFRDYVFYLRFNVEWGGGAGVALILSLSFVGEEGAVCLQREGERERERKDINTGDIPDTHLAFRLPCELC